MAEDPGIQALRVTATEVEQIKRLLDDEGEPNEALREAAKVGDWDSAMVGEALRLGPFGTTREGLWQRYTRGAAQGRHPLTSYSNSQKRAFFAAVDLVTEALLGWETDPPEHRIWELRRGEKSIFFPMFYDPTLDPDDEYGPSIVVECPSGRRHNPGMEVTTDIRGECSACSYDLVGGVLTTERNSDG